MRPPQIIERSHSVALSLQRARPRKKGHNKCPVWCAIGAETKAASAKSGDRSNDFSDETLAGIVAELILAVLDINRLKVRLGFCRG
jgi:hypothetical protein